MQSKDRLRKKFYSIRKKNYFDVKPNFFSPLTKLIKKRYSKKNINLSLYYPASFEVNVLKLFEKKSIRNVKFFLPVIKKKNLMDFYEWNNREVLKINKFGMLEPFIKLNHTVPNIMLIPLLAFDTKNNRLGYGKGYYDNFLNKYLKKNKNILTIGVAFSFQRYDKLPISKYDVSLNYILTEKNLI